MKTRDLLLDQGELILFCKDFTINLPKSKILEIFIKVSKDKKLLDYDQFKQIVPILCYEYSLSKSKEIKERLREIKEVLIYPDN